MANDPYDNDPRGRDDELRLPAPHDAPTQHADHQLPWPAESDPHALGDEFVHAERPDERSLGKSFADPNSLDDKRIGKSFEETNASGKKKTHTFHVEKKEQSRRILWISLIAFLVLFLLVLLIGWLPRHNRDKENEKRAKAEGEKKPQVEVTRVSREADEAGLVVPGTTIPFEQAFIYARANGYLKRRYVDIGDHVKKDQVLGVIDAPDLDAQVDQARQQVKQAQQQLEQQESQLALATVTVERYRVLVTKGVLSRQQGDQQEATYRSDEANVAAAARNVEAYKANLQRAIALQSYEYVRAPFAGVITQRNVDTGALIAAGGNASGALTSPAPQGQSSTSGGTAQAGQSNDSGSSGGSSTAATSAQSPGQGGPLFAVAQVDRLRILVSVPEGYAPAMHNGGTARLAFQEYPGVPFFGLISRNADSIDANTRTMLTEVDVNNQNNKLIAGMYVVATFPPAPGAETPILIPGDAVAIRHDTSVVAIVKGGKVDIVPITLGRDFGSVIEVLSGLQVGDLLVSDVTDDIVQGAPVDTKLAKSPLQQSNKPPSQTTPPGGSTQYGDQGITDRNLQGQQSKQNAKGSGGAQGNANKTGSGSKQ
jgi:multidrug efflux pump subunit AcrA (membrane-fusion protein)